MRGFSFPAVASLAAVAVTVGIALTPPLAEATGAITLLGNGIGTARFGQPEATAIPNLDKALGSPKATRPTQYYGNCSVDAFLEWPKITAYFFHNRFVGYSTGPVSGKRQPRSIPDVATAAGLRVGDTLTTARQIYGHALRASLAQGGSWFARTPSGTLDGYLTNEANRTKPPPRIGTIEAGAVGCPAASP